MWARSQTGLVNGTEMSSNELLPLAGYQITRCVVDHAFTLESFDPVELIVIRFNSTFELISDSGGTILTPDEPTKLGPALAAIHQVIRAATIDASGALSIDIEGIGTFRAVGDPRWEAWEIAGPRKSRWVCVAGGEIVRWPAVS